MTAPFADEITVAELDRDPYPIYARLRAEAPGRLGAGGRDVAGDRLGRGAARSPRSRSCSPPTCRARRSTAASAARRSSPATASRTSELRRADRSEVTDRGRSSSTSRTWSLRSRTSGSTRVAGRGDVELMAEVLRAGLGPQPGGAARRRSTSATRRCGAGSRGWRTARPTSSATRPSSGSRTTHAPRSTSELEPLLDRLEREPDDCTISHMIHDGHGEGGDPPARGDRPDDQGDPARRYAGARARCGLGSTRAAPSPRAAGRGPRRPRRACSMPRSRRGCDGSRRSGPRVAARSRRPYSPASSCRWTQPVAAVISSANRDASRFPDPDRFDIHRPRQRVATFGFGHHFCSGHAFARGLERVLLRGCSIGSATSSSTPIVHRR